MSSLDASSVQSRRPPPRSPVDAARPAAGASPVPLRLTATRGCLGLELYDSFELGPVTVRSLSVTLPGLKFPVDLTGGVPVFRHRRGQLEQVSLELAADTLSRWVTPRVAGVLGDLVRPVSIWPLEDGLGAGLVTRDAALAFDLLWASSGSDARLVVSRARAAGLGGPALAVALRVLDAAVGGFASRRGRIITLPQMAQSVSRWVLPALGVRAPRAHGMQFRELVVAGDHVRLQVESGAPPPVIRARAARALELGELLVEADDAVAAGQPELARSAYLHALEQAPRHPEIALCIAELDLAVGDRSEAALGLIVESQPAVRAGAVAAELLMRVGDRAAAREAVAGAARDESFAPLAALHWGWLASLEEDAQAEMTALDRAVACAPALESVRWQRFASRAARGQVEAALADAEHLEAAATGSRDRHRQCRAAARELLRAGFVREAGRLFERALRYLPDDAAATAGLARALIESGRSDRAFTLLERAVELGERSGHPECEALLDLGRLLAGDLGDLPQAIARVRQVSAASDCGREARALEARWRARLGDRVGASLAYARLRETIELAPKAEPRASQWLREAAVFEQEVQGDVASAERHLGLALRLAPGDRRLAEEYRAVAAVLADRQRGVPEAPALPTAEDPRVLEDEAQRLRSAVQGDPTNLDQVLRLVEVLEALERDEEAFALLSASLDEHPHGEYRQRLVSRTREVTLRLLQLSRDRGALDDVELYQAFVEGLSRDD